MIVSSHSMQEDIAVICITRHGIEIARKIKNYMPSVKIYAQSKHKDSADNISWFDGSASNIVSTAFKSHSALICVFSLGAVIRLISPLVVNKKTDPAVLVVDDKATFVISALSGHLGGANMLTKSVASLLNAQPVITTAADVNETITVDLLGNEFGWTIENFDNVTKVSALVVNEERIGIYQDAGEKNWWTRGNLPRNVTQVSNLDALLSKEIKGCIIISDRILVFKELLEKSVVYRPKSLVVGIGLHEDTSVEDIIMGINQVFHESNLSISSIRNISCIDRAKTNIGLSQFSAKYNIPVTFFDKEELSKVEVPNPSQVVKKFEGTPSVSEASAILSSGGYIIVPKCKFPPNLTVAVGKINFK
jgi:cobalt-precorrin 5A hydrolase